MILYYFLLVVFFCILFLIYYIRIMIKIYIFNVGICEMLNAKDEFFITCHYVNFS